MSHVSQVTNKMRLKIEDFRAMDQPQLHLHWKLSTPHFWEWELRKNFHAEILWSYKSYVHGRLVENRFALEGGEQVVLKM